jgi:antitoxin YefM
MGVQVRYTVPVLSSVPMMTTFMTATAARKQFFKFLSIDKKPGQHIAVTHEGIPKLVLMSFDEFEGWMETLEIMSDPQLVKDIRDARNEPLDKAIPWEKVKKEFDL